MGGGEDKNIGKLFFFLLIIILTAQIANDEAFCSLPLSRICMSLSELKASPFENNNLKTQVKPDVFIKNSKEDDQFKVVITDCSP